MKRVINKENRIGENIMTVIQNTDFWIGITTIVFLTVFGLIVYRNYRPKSNTAATKEATKSAVLEITKKASLSVKPTIIITKSPIKEIVKIKKLADTTGYYIVKSGDSFSLISKKECGSEAFFQSIKEENNYSEGESLQPGDLIIVNCGN